MVRSPSNQPACSLLSYATLRAGEAVAGISARFHSAVAEAVVSLAHQARAAGSGDSDLDTVALGGGVFQNARLLRECVRGLTVDGFEVLVPTRVPPNDGGIALGQVLVASAMQTSVAGARSFSNSTSGSGV